MLVTLSMETSQMLCCAAYGIIALAIAIPIAAWWERRHP